jgi:ring-1,2-phenylacetyl-CoA epoxidase subunit PaaD
VIARADIDAALRTVFDPEMPINIVDLGVVAAVDIRTDPHRPQLADVDVAITPTFVGCPAFQIIQQEAAQRVRGLPGVGSVQVRVVYDPPWSVDRITAAGRAALKAAGITVPQPGAAPMAQTAFVRLSALAPDAPAAPAAATAASMSTSPANAPAASATASQVACPLCGSMRTRLESPFGPTRCKMIYYCDACRNTFEHVKSL